MWQSGIWKKRSLQLKTKGKKHRNSWTLYNKFSRENIAKIFFSESIIDLQTLSDSFSSVFFVGIIAIYDRK